MFGLLFFVALAGGMAINAPSASAAITVNTQPTTDFTTGTYKADAVFSVVKFGITQDAAETLSSVAVTIVAEGTAASGDFASLKVYKKKDETTVGFQSGEDTLVGTQETVNVGSATTISTGATAIGTTETTFYVVATIAASPTDTNAFSVDVATDGVVTSENSPTVTVLDGGATAIATIDTTAPTGFASQVYEDSDGDGTVDQVVIVIDGNLTICSVTDAEIGTDWTYTGNDIGGSLALSGDEETNFCDLDTGTGTITLKITGANENTTGHTIAPRIAYDNDDTDNSIADNDDNLGDVAEEITDGAAPVMISAVYKDISGDGIVDSIDVTYSEDIGSSTFTKSEWSFPIDSNPHNLDVDSVLISPDSTTDVRIAITSSDSEDLIAINDTIVEYTATTTGGGIIDGATNYAVDAELPVRVEGYIDIPSGGTPKLKQPNPNSGVTLYRLDGSPRVYVIKNKKRHWIQTPKEFNAAGYNWGKVKVVSAETLEEYPEAEDSTTELLRAVGSHKVYKINNGKRRWIKTAGEFNAAGYKWKDIKEVSSEVLASYQNEVLSELLRAVGDYKVYKLKGGKKYWIRTAEEFNAAGHSWEDVEDVDAEILDDYPNSE